MRRIISTVVLLALIGFSGSQLSAATNDEKTVKFAVVGMTCATCPISVRKAMERVKGVKHVKVDIETKIATVIYDASMATASDIGNASTNVGFPASQLAEK